MKNQKNVSVYKQPELGSNWLTRKQASIYLQCGLSTLDTNLPIKKYFLGKSVRYLKSDLDEFLLANCKEPESKKINNEK